MKDHILCRFCKWFSESGRKFVSRFVNTTFSVDGFSNWRKALEKLAVHESSTMHKEAISAHAVFTGQHPGVDSMLCSLN